MTDIDRRTFLTGLSAASAFTIVPRRVLGGQGFVAPSDMIRLAQVGCGLQSQRQVNTGFVQPPRRPVRGGRRSEPRQPELCRLERVRQPQPDSTVPRATRLGRRRQRDSRRT